MKTKNNVVELEISELLPNGEGLCQKDSQRIQVRNALPGESVSARILKKRKGVKYSDGVEIKNASSARMESSCSYFPRCGGCSMLHMKPAIEIELKQNKLLSDLHENGIVFDDVLKPNTKNVLGYRRKARLGVKCLGDTVLVGFRESFSSRVARIDHCEILSPRLSSLIVELKEVISRCSIRNHIPQIELAEGDDGIALIVRHLEELSNADLLLWQELSENTSASVFFQSAGYDSLILLDSKSSKANLSYSLLEHGVFLEFLPEQFIQVNHQINLELIRTALCFFGDLRGKVIQDYFSGIGNFSLPLARNGAHVFGYELSSSSVDMALRNTLTNQLKSRATFSVVDLYKDLPEVTSYPDYILIDPPRSGAGPNLSRWLEPASCQKLVYISCNSESFARDARIINNQGFKSQQIALFNMFPGTAHFEIVSLFIRE